MATQGPNYPTNVVDSASGDISWSNVTGVQQVGGVAATSTGALPNLATDAIYAEGFNFNIPGNAIICGILVEVNLSASQNDGGSTNYVVDLHTILLVAGSPDSNDGSSGTLWPTSAVTRSYGGSTDLWGLSWTPVDINASGFGVYFAAQVNGTAGLSTIATIDFIRITVFIKTPRDDNQPLVSAVTSIATKIIDQVVGY